MRPLAAQRTNQCRPSLENPRTKTLRRGLYNEGFGSSDILGRKKTSKALANLLERIDDPLVQALNVEWGTGKSYFLKRWVGAHTIENNSSSTVVYFDRICN